MATSVLNFSVGGGRDGLVSKLNGISCKFDRNLLFTLRMRNDCITAVSKCPSLHVERRRFFHVSLVKHRGKRQTSNSMSTLSPVSSEDENNKENDHWLSPRLLELDDFQSDNKENIYCHKSDQSISHSLNFQVLSDEEQIVREATAAHPRALKALYCAFFCSCFSEHTWRFAMPAVLSLLDQSLLPVAVASFSGQLVTFLFGPWVGELMDRLPRVLAFNSLIIAQVVSMLISAAVLVYAIKSGTTKGITPGKMFMQPWFLVLVLSGSTERLSGLASGVAIERDWVVQLAGHNRPIALANANATLRRVDLLCEIAGPLVFGILLSKYETVQCIGLATVIMVITLPLLIFCVKLTNSLSCEVLDRRKPKAVYERTTEEINATSGLHSVKKGWSEYLAQSVLPASLAYVLLNFNAVLSPGGLMTSFLTQRGLDVSIIGLFRGACGAMGFLATFISAPLIASRGVLQAGAVALAMQSLALTVSVLVYFFTPMANKATLFFFLFLVVVSRLGHWTYDCVDAQIFQTAIPEGQANLIGTTEVSLSSLAELVMLAMAIVAHDVRHFGVLSVLSMSSILLATAVYWHWLANPSPEQRRLFPGTANGGGGGMAASLVSAGL